MRKTILSFALAATLAAAPSVARADSPGTEVGFALWSAFANLAYTPAKVVVALVGLPVGAAAGFLNGGDTRAAYAIWVRRSAEATSSRPIWWTGASRSSSSARTTPTGQGRTGAPTTAAPRTKQSIPTVADQSVAKAQLQGATDAIR